MNYSKKRGYMLPDYLMINGVKCIFVYCITYVLSIQ